MLRRVLIAGLALALVVPVLAGAEPESRRGERVPSAQLQATGRGSMTVTGRMSVNGSILDRGVVLIRDRGDDAEAHLAGVALTFKRGRVKVRRASGILYVTGSAITVKVASSRLSFSIAGKGRARLLGSGTYRLNSDREKRWRRGWIKVAPPSHRRRRRAR